MEGRIIEPGHQFEWAYLLLKSPWAHAETVQRAALRLIAAGERGVRNGVAVNSLLDDFTVHDPDARLWPQTERLKAALLAARVTGEELLRVDGLRGRLELASLSCDAGVRDCGSTCSCPTAAWSIRRPRRAPCTTWSRLSRHSMRA